MADQQPQKNEKSGSGGGGKRKNRRYFRRRKNKNKGGQGNAQDGGPSSGEQQRDQQGGQSQAKAQGGRGTDQQGDQPQKRRKRRRSNNRGGGDSNQRSSNRRRRRQGRTESPAPVAPEPEGYVEPVDVFVHTHIVRPAYRDAGNEYVSEASFLSKRRPAEASAHIERLQEEIRGHLDEWFNRPNTPAKVTREPGDEDWDEEE